MFMMMTLPRVCCISKVVPSRSAVRNSGADASVVEGNRGADRGSIRSTGVGLLPDELLPDEFLLACLLPEGLSGLGLHDINPKKKKHVAMTIKWRTGRLPKGRRLDEMAGAVGVDFVRDLDGVACFMG